ncbi:LOW QUALITY PROTEIN: hypothetical protein PanWU01x14_188430, partial [Parasponia andersonii]
LLSQLCLLSHFCFFHPQHHPPLTHTPHFLLIQTHRPFFQNLTIFRGTPRNFLTFSSKSLRPTTRLRFFFLFLCMTKSFVLGLLAPDLARDVVEFDIVRGLD